MFRFYHFSSKSLLLLDNPADVWVSNLHKTLKYPVHHVLMSHERIKSGWYISSNAHLMSWAQPSPTLLPPSRRIRNRHIVYRHTGTRLEYGMKNWFSCSKPSSFNQPKLTLMRVSVQKAYFPPHKQKPDAIFCSKCVQPRSSSRCYYFVLNAYFSSIHTNLK